MVVGPSAMNSVDASQTTGTDLHLSAGQLKCVSSGTLRAKTRYQLHNGNVKKGYCFNGNSWMSHPALLHLVQLEVW